MLKQMIREQAKFQEVQKAATQTTTAGESLTLFYVGVTDKTQKCPQNLR